jgi:hypothetical protein
LLLRRLQRDLWSLHERRGALLKKQLLLLLLLLLRRRLLQLLRLRLSGRPRALRERSHLRKWERSAVDWQPCRRLLPRPLLRLRRGNHLLLQRLLRQRLRLRLRL